MFKKPLLVLLMVTGLVQLSCNLGSSMPNAREVQATVQAQITVDIEPTATFPPEEKPPESSPTFEIPTEVPAPQATRPLISLKPFEGWSEEYQVIQVPDVLQQEIDQGKAKVVPLPKERTRYSGLFYNNVTDQGILGPYDLDRLALFQEPDHAPDSFAAVPARNIPETPDFKEEGVLVGLVYDQNAFYGKDQQAVYEVYFYDTKAEIRNQATGEVVRTLERGKDYFWTDSKSNPEALAFFIKNGCWLCWNAGGRTGCLICF